MAAHDGFAKAILPTHTQQMATWCSLAIGRSGKTLEPNDAIDMFAAAGATMARAIARAVYAATPAENDPMPVWSSRR
jgi:L-aminopeptidase/D-esterase-like protein